MQALGWRKNGRYLPLQDGIAWYQAMPSNPLKPLPQPEFLEID